MLLGPNCQLNLKITNNALPFTEQALAAAHLSGSKNVVWSSAAEAAAGAKEKKQVSESSSPLYQNFTRFWNETDIDLQMSKNMTQIPSWFNTLNLSQFWYYWSQKWFSTITWNSFLGTFAKLPLFPSMRVFDWASIQYIPPLLWSFACVFCVFEFAWPNVEAGCDAECWRSTCFVSPQDNSQTKFLKTAMFEYIAVVWIFYAQSHKLGFDNTI